MQPGRRVAKDRCSSVAKCHNATKTAFAVGRLCLGDVAGESDLEAAAHNAHGIDDISKNMI